MVSQTKNGSKNTSTTTGEIHFLPFLKMHTNNWQMTLSGSLQASSALFKYFSPHPNYLTIYHIYYDPPKNYTLNQRNHKSILHRELCGYYYIMYKIFSLNWLKNLSQFSELNFTRPFTKGKQRKTKYLFCVIQRSLSLMLVLAF